MSVHSEETYTCRIDACNDKVCSDMSLVAEKVLFEHGHDCDDAGGAAGG